MSPRTDNEVGAIDVRQLCCLQGGVLLTFINYGLELNQPADHSTTRSGEGGPAWHSF